MPLRWSASLSSSERASTSLDDLDELELRLKLFVKRDALFSDPQRGGSFLAPGGKSRWPAARFGAARGQRRGRPIVVTEPDSQAARTIDAVADKLLDMSARRIRLPVREHCQAVIAGPSRASAQLATAPRPQRLPRIDPGLLRSEPFSWPPVGILRWPLTSGHMDASD